MSCKSHPLGSPAPPPVKVFFLVDDEEP